MTRGERGATAAVVARKGDLMELLHRLSRRQVIGKPSQLFIFGLTTRHPLFDEEMHSSAGLGTVAVLDGCGRFSRSSAAFELMSRNFIVER